MSLPDWIMTHGEALQPTLFFSLLLVLAIVEPVFPRRPGPTDRRQETMRLGLDEVLGRDAHRPLWLLRSLLTAHLGPKPDAQRRVSR